MTALTKGRPPFRADHVGSLLRPAPLRQAFRAHGAKEIGDAEFKRIQDQCIRDVVALQACHPRFFASHRYLAFARPLTVTPPGATGPATSLAAG